MEKDVQTFEGSGLLCIDCALLFSDEEQAEQVVQQTIPQQNQAGRQEAAKVIVIPWRGGKRFLEEDQSLEKRFF